MNQLLPFSTTAATVVLLLQRAFASGEAAGQAGYALLGAPPTCRGWSTG